eukprot:TRINITY_DN35233_c0_g1_i1.p1 TRINITY_DN35233_c0_g1~~TRINITY_DN35233_c0_g1_i1.p1  ORF type:complete len:165 (+),score=23.99 TRINITY_DN35233_c0_g1_i1:205-699(+)
MNVTLAGVKAIGQYYSDAPRNRFLLNATFPSGTRQYDLKRCDWEEEWLVLDGNCTRTLPSVPDCVNTPYFFPANASKVGSGVPMNGYSTEVWEFENNVPGTPAYKETTYVATLPAGEHVVVLANISNPPSLELIMSFRDIQPVEWLPDHIFYVPDECHATCGPA